ncbi:hypothetical protein MKX54_20335 [Alkalihalobacillus sp. FSL R5-0424]
MINYQKSYNKHIKDNQLMALESIKKSEEKIDVENLMIINEKIPVFHRPGLIDKSYLDIIHNDINQISNIIREIPERIFGNNLDEMCEFLNLSSNHKKLIKSSFLDDRVLMTRCDIFFESEFSYKFLEMNIDSSVGGLDIFKVNELIEETEIFQVWNRDSEWSYINPLDKYVSKVHQMIKDEGGTKGTTLAIVDWHEYINGYMWTLGLFKESFEREGYNVIICNQREFTTENDKLYHDNIRIDVVFRVFPSDDAFKYPEELTSIYEAYSKGNLILISGVHTELYANKAIFALLSDPTYKEHFSKNEIDVIDRCIPWTRILKKEKDLLKYVICSKDQIVIKPSLGYGGIDIHLGWNYESQQWIDLIETLLLSDELYILQEKVTPMIEKMPEIKNEKITFNEVINNWGIYSFDNELAGGVIRGLAVEKHGIINASQGASITSIFFKE